MSTSDFVHSYFEAWNHCDAVAVANHLACNGTYCDVPANTHRSHDELIVSLTTFFSTYKHRYELIGEILEGPDTIAFQYRMCPLVKDRKAAALEPIRGAEFITLNGNAALTIFDYYEVPGANRPLGLVELSNRRTASNGKYAKSGLSEEQLSHYKQRLEYVMHTEQAYLRSDLTLPKLASIVDCSVNHLSQVINAGFGVSFFDYLNEYRVEHAKGLLTELNGKGSAVLNIAFTVGFNSNSAFYAAFKKYVGQTPAQFRRTNCKSPH
ncbi:MAG: helix-turn-helix domain-containing protein [Pseudomonadota bacterium]